MDEQLEDAGGVAGGDGGALKDSKLGWEVEKDSSLLDDSSDESDEKVMIV